MKLKDFMKAMQAIEQDRSLSQDIVVAALKEALAKAYRKHIEIPDALVRVDINEKSGEIKVYQQLSLIHILTVRIFHLKHSLALRVIRFLISI